MPVIRDFEVGGIYHIFNRGWGKKNIFLDETDFLRFIVSLYWFNNDNNIIIDDLTSEDRNFITASGSTAGNYANNSRNIKNRKPVVEILAFTLMTNHYHLVVREITLGGVSLFMQKLGGGYTGYFNEKHNKKGYGGIFQGRYKSVRIESDGQLIAIFNYVHTNPIGLVEPMWKDFIVKNKSESLNFLKNYRWSSYNDYIGKPTFPHVIQGDFYNDILGGSKRCERAVKDWIDFKANKNLLRADL